MVNASGNNTKANVSPLQVQVLSLTAITTINLVVRHL